MNATVISLHQVWICSKLMETFSEGYFLDTEFFLENNKIEHNTYNIFSVLNLKRMEVHIVYTNRVQY